MGDSVERVKETLVGSADRISPSPEARANYVYNALRASNSELTEWDLVCFSANYLGSVVALLPWLEKPAKHICSLVYTAHYQDDGTNTDSGIANTRADRSNEQDSSSA